MEVLPQFQRGGQRHIDEDKSLREEPGCRVTYVPLGVTEPQ